MPIDDILGALIEGAGEFGGDVAVEAADRRSRAGRIIRAILYLLVTAGCIWWAVALIAEHRGPGEIVGASVLGVIAILGLIGVWSEARTSRRRD